MSDSHEPSYYEIALTNRQVLVGLVLLLLCVLAAFLGGVWLGQKQPDPGTRTVIADNSSAQPGGEVDEFTFFSEEGETDRPASPPDLGRVREPRATSPSPSNSTLAEDVGQSVPPIESPPPPRVEPPPPPRVEPPPPRVEPPPPPPPPVEPPPPARERPAVEPTSGFIIQVFSTREEAQARKVRDQLTGGGYQAFLSPVRVGSGTMHRVRIGPFQDRAAAERAAGKINRSFKLDTWITAAGN